CPISSSARPLEAAPRILSRAVWQRPPPAPSTSTSAWLGGPRPQCPAAFTAGSQLQIVPRIRIREERLLVASEHLLPCVLVPRSELVDVAGEHDFPLEPGVVAK